MESIHLSVVIPAFNEEGRIKKTLKKIESYLTKNDYPIEIIVVDDGSVDNTVNIVEELRKNNGNIFLLKNKFNRGKGYSVRKGMLYAQGKLVLFSDADLSTPIEEIEKFFPWFDQGYDIVIGSRGLPQSRIVVHQPFYRETIGRIFNFLVQLLVIGGIKDTQCGFKCFKSDVAKDLFEKQTIPGFCFDVEILLMAVRKGLKIKEVPIKWFNSSNTKVNMFFDSFIMFWDLLKISIRSKTLFRRSRSL